MTDLTKLKELAERASVVDWSFSPCVADKHFLGQVWNGSGESLCIMDHMTEQANTDGAFIAAANPKAILGLIAEVERLHRVAESAWSKADEFGNKMFWLNWDQAKRGGFENVLDERDLLKAENEALRKDAERYRWLRSKEAECNVEIPMDDGRGWVLPGYLDELDAAIDAALEGGGR